MSGFNLPPGCSTRDIDRAFGMEGPCQVCGQSVDDCICPECPVCNSVGDPACYLDSQNPSSHHCLVRNIDQIVLYAAAEAEWIEDAANENDYYRFLEWADAQEVDAQEEDYYRLIGEEGI